jgi:hypothetical protein
MNGSKSYSESYNSDLSGEKSYGFKIDNMQLASIVTYYCIRFSSEMINQSATEIGYMHCIWPTRVIVPARILLLSVYTS